MITMHARQRQTDRQTDEHHGNSATIRSMNASRANKIEVVTYAMQFACDSYQDTTSRLWLTNMPLLHLGNTARC